MIQPPSNATQPEAATGQTPRIAALATLTAQLLCLPFPTPASTLHPEPQPPSPSSRRTDWVISEFLLSPSPASLEAPPAFVELANAGLIPESLGGHQLQGAFRFTFPPNTTVPPGGRLVVTPTATALPNLPPSVQVLGGLIQNPDAPHPGSLRLLNPAGAVLLAIEDPTQSPRPTQMLAGHSRVLTRPSYGEGDPRAWSTSSAPGGTPGTSEPVSATHPNPPSPLPPPPTPDVIFHEIFYHPVDDDAELEFVELFNRSLQPQDLGGWRLQDGVTFSFPAGTHIPPRGFLVIARNRARLLEAHPDLIPTLVLGDFRGRLANEGERLALERPAPSPSSSNPTETSSAFTLVDEVTYDDTEAWGLLADGGGSSLELLHPDANNDEPSQWAASDESGKAPWTTIEVDGPLVGGVGLVNQLQILAQRAGAFLIDEVEVFGDATGNLVPNPDFLGDMIPWIASGTHAESSWSPQPEAGLNGALRVQASARGDTGANQVRTPLHPGLVYGGHATLRARLRWLQGHPEALIRLRGNHLEAFVPLRTPANPGTPGRPNSRALANPAPVLADVSQEPILPSPGQPVTVTARVEDPDGVASVTLRYRVDPSPEFVDQPMLPDPAVPHRFVGTLPGYPAGTLIAFEILATDQGSPAATRRFPRGAPPCEALVRFGEIPVPGPVATYRLWITQSVLDTWTRRSQLDNTPLPVTFVHNDDRVVHGVGAFYAGSHAVAPSYDHPAGKPCGYMLRFPKDEPFLGATEIVLDWPRFDATAQQESFAHWLARELKVPFNHRRFIRLHLNGITESQRGTIYEDAQQVNGDLIASWMPGDTGGALHKLEQWVEFSDTLATASVVSPRLEAFRLPDGQPNLARYRWTWLPRAIERSANDFTRLLDLVEAANQPEGTHYPGELARRIDAEEWMRVFAIENMVVNFDAWGYDIGKNLYAYAPPNGPWRLFLWDIDWVMTTSAFYGYSPTSPLMYRGPARFSDGNRDPVVGRMYDQPSFQRAYWRAIADAVHGPLHPERAAARMEPLHQALVAAGVSHAAGQPLAPPTEALAWVRARREYLLQQLAEVSAPFTLDPTPTTTPDPRLVLGGTAPIEAVSIAVNDVAQEVRWSSVTRWELRLPLPPGTHSFRITPLDHQGHPLAEPRSLAVTRAGSRILSIHRTPQGTPVIRLSTAPNTRCSLEFTPLLPAPSWATVAGGIAGPDGLLELSDPSPSRVEPRYYRIRNDPASPP